MLVGCGLPASTAMGVMLARLVTWQMRQHAAACGELSWCRGPANDSPRSRARQTSAIARKRILACCGSGCTLPNYSCSAMLAMIGTRELSRRYELPGKGAVADGRDTVEAVPEKTMGQRIFRAKRTLSEAHIPFESPRGDELRRRVESVLSVVYLIFNEGYTATSGEEWMWAALCDEALRLGRMLVEFLSGESEAHALLALMELNASRTAARRGSNGEAVLLPDQDRFCGITRRSSEEWPGSNKRKD